ncbi:MAG: sugar nucleotide-binding protein [Candidatus Omnitrophota bacterium]|jgi:dTDP-4-dehydrorhamnose reductase
MSATDVAYLVVGGDGVIGSQLVKEFRSSGVNVVATTRRAVEGGESLMRLDLASDSDLSSWTCPAKNGVAFLCAGITSIASCETEPWSSRRVNVTNTLALARSLYASGMRIVFLSSNAVFDGAMAEPEEDSAYCPSTEYGRQKVSTEQGLIALSEGVGSVAIVRLSKVLTSTSGVTAEFIRRLAAGKPCPAFDDLRMSPISLSYVLKALFAIAGTKYPGIFHLSGAEEMSYADFARRLATSMGADPGLVRPLSSTALGVRVLFRPKHPALDMKRTGKLLGIAPEPTTHLLKQLVAGN